MTTKTGFTVEVFRKILMIKYWIKILIQNNSSFIKKMYVNLKTDVDSNINYKGKNWVYLMKCILRQHGFEYVGVEQSEIDIPYNTKKQRIVEMYFQKWYSDINNLSGLVRWAKWLTFHFHTTL